EPEPQLGGQRRGAPGRPVGAVAVEEGVEVGEDAAPVPPPEDRAAGEPPGLPLVAAAPPELLDAAVVGLGPRLERAWPLVLRAGQHLGEEVLEHLVDEDALLERA